MHPHPPSPRRERSRRPARATRPSTDAEDRRAAERSLPTPADGAARRPAIDPDVWLDHLRLARHDDQDALGRLVAEYERYARSLAGRMHRGHDPREDLDQIALEALVLALRRFDPDRGLPFPAFATPTILGALRRHFRDHGWLVRVPRRIHEFAVAERRAVDRLREASGHQPTPAELASELDLRPDELRAAQDAVHARDHRSLDAPIAEGLTLADELGTTDEGLALALERVDAAEAMADLSDRDQRVLSLYYLEDLTQSQVAVRMGVSQMQISRLLASAIGQLRSAVAA